MKKALKAALVLLVLFLVVHTVLSFVWGRQLKAKLAELKACGEPLTYAELKPDPVPESENGAVLYLKVFAAAKLPNYGINDPFFRFLEANASEQDRRSLVPEIREILRQNREALSLVRMAATKPRCVFPPEWDEQPSQAYRCQSNLRRVSDMLRARARLAAMDGRPAQAVDDLVLAVRVAQALAESPNGGSFVMRAYHIRQAAGTLREIAAAAQIPQAHARRVYDELAALSLRPQFARVAQYQRIEGNRFYDDFRRNGGPYYPSGSG